MQTESNDAGYLFAGYRLDPLRGMLFDATGAELHLRPKPFALLRYLLDHPGRLFGRDELLAALWPGVVVTDDSLTQCISELRRAFGGQAAEVLRTVPRRGYILAATVQRETAVGPSAPSTPREDASTAGPALPSLGLQRRDMLLVVPPTALPGDAAAARLGSAFAADLTAELIRFEDLRVVAGPDTSASQGYAAFLEVHVVGAAARIVVRLEDIATGTSFWADRITCPADGRAPPFAAISALAGAIDLQIGRKSLRRAQQKAPGQWTAREHMLLGRELHQRGTEKDTIAARERFLNATQIDPTYAAPYAWAAFTLMRVVTFDWNAKLHGGGADAALDLARRAARLDPESPLCQSALAFALSLTGHWDEAVDIARLALQLSRVADYGARSACGEVLTAAGHPEETIAALRETLSLDPHCPPRTRAILGRALLLANEPEEALRELRRCAAHLPDYAPCARTMVVAAIETGMVEEARTAVQLVRHLRPQWLPGGEPIFWFLRRPGDIARFEKAFAVALRLDAAVASGGLARPSATPS
jgi:DNA-binding winged helix-turn-helix (wHTH) protein/tetratricopeptide (TPR) repeat protein